MKNVPIYARYEDGTKSAATMSGADCTYTLMVKQNSKIHMVVDNSASASTLATWTQEEVSVGSTPLTNVVAHGCTSLPYSAPLGVATAASLTGDQLRDQGVCMYGTLGKFTPPNVTFVPNTSITVTPAGFDVYAGTMPPSMTTPFVFAKQDSSPTALFGIRKPGGVTAATEITIEATDPMAAGSTRRSSATSSRASSRSPVSPRINSRCGITCGLNPIESCSRSARS